MKYIDSFETSKFKTKGNKSLFKHIDTIIKNDLLQIDLLHEAIINCDKIIQNIKQNNCENKDDLIDKYSSIKHFYDVICRYLLLEADVLVPYKYLLNNFSASKIDIIPIDNLVLLYSDKPLFL